MSKLEKFLRGRFAASLAAVIIGFAVASVVLAVAGFDPIASFAALFNGAFGKPKYITNVIIKATPILLTGVESPSPSRRVSSTSAPRDSTSSARCSQPSWA